MESFATLYMTEPCKFNSRSQQEGESVEDFIYHVNALADHYEDMANFKMKWYATGS